MDVDDHRATSRGERKGKFYSTRLPILSRSGGVIRSMDRRRRGPVGHRGPLAGNGVVGRYRELERFDQMQSRLRAGRGGAIALPGDPGIGKTRLLAVFRSRTEAAGLPLLAGRPGGEMPDPAQVAVAARGAAEGVVVCLDDLHRLPAAGNTVVDELLQLAATEPVLVVLAYRPRQLGPALAALLSRADAAGALSRAPLASLPTGEAEAVVGDHPERARIVAVGTGNPLYLRILMEPTAEAAGPLLGEIAELGADAQLVAREAATLGDPFSLELLMAACPLERRAITAALDALVVADIVRPRLRGSPHGRTDLPAFRGGPGHLREQPARASA